MNVFDGDYLIATIRKFSDWKPGLDFVTDDDKFLQVGTWNYDKGKVLDRHEHNIHQRYSTITQECVFVVTGAMKVKFYSRNRKFLQYEILERFDYAIIFGGGHEYEILENDTKIIETKNGPFPGVIVDKTRY